MKRYQILVTRSAEKDLARIPSKLLPGIVEAIDGLMFNARPAGYKKLKGEFEDIYRIRKGDYRILYSVEESIQIVEVRRIRHRKEVYGP